MTKEYIEREKAIKEAIAERDLHSPFTPELSGWRVGAEKVANRLASIPAADVVEVVRCRECFFRELDGADIPVCTGAMAYCNTPDDWYCSCGKRKEVFRNGR